ncbi:hypothetical protein BJ546DRAFT_26633 [Cryomyces antarcticus]
MEASLVVAIIIVLCWTVRRASVCSLSGLATHVAELCTTMLDRMAYFNQLYDMVTFMALLIVRLLSEVEESLVLLVYSTDVRLVLDSERLALCACVVSAAAASCLGTAHRRRRNESRASFVSAVDRGDSLLPRHPRSR